MAPLDGVFRLTARYEAFGRPASMVFTFRRYDLAPPTYEDCLSVCQQYGLWEDSGGGFGYTLLRSANSYFTVANARSIDPRSNAVFIDTPFRRGGQLPDLGSQMIASSVAPLIRWKCAGVGFYVGRTFAVGVAQSTLLAGADAQTCTLVTADDLVTEFRRLIPPPFPASVAGMVILTRRRGLVGGAGLLALEVLDSAMPSHLMSTQRRRTVHGRG